MENTGYIALSAQSALRRQMDVIANNIANMNTSAYKAEEMLFVEHLQKSRGQERIGPAKLAFVRDIALVRDLADGPVKNTGNPLDFALRGDGYFVVQTEDGDRYTRNGRFHLDEGGALVTENGRQVMSTAGTPIFFAPEDKEIHVARDGTISSDAGEIGQLRVVRFEDERDLLKVSGNLLSTDQAPQDVERPEILQHALEGSNVQPIVEVTRMIDTHRTYDNVRQFIEREDQRIRKMMEEMSRTG